MPADFSLKLTLSGTVGASGAGNLEVLTKIDGQKSMKLKQIQIPERWSNILKTGI